MIASDALIFNSIATIEPFQQPAILIPARSEYIALHYTQSSIIKEKEYGHYRWLMCKKNIKKDWKSSSAQTLYFFKSPKGIFKETSAPLNPSISDFGTLYSWRSPSLVITTVFPSIASTFPAS